MLGFADGKKQELGSKELVHLLTTSLSDTHKFNAAEKSESVPLAGLAADITCLMSNFFLKPDSLYLSHISH